MNQPLLACHEIPFIPAFSRVSGLQNRVKHLYKLDFSPCHCGCMAHFPGPALLAHVGFRRRSLNTSVLNSSTHTCGLRRWESSLWPCCWNETATGTSTCILFGVCYKEINLYQHISVDSYYVFIVPTAPHLTPPPPPLLHKFLADRNVCASCTDCAQLPAPMEKVPSKY